MANIYTPDLVSELSEVTQVMQRLFLGSLTTAKELVLANPRNITTIVNCCDAEYQAPIGCHVYNIPFRDGYDVPVECLDKCLAAIFKGIRDGNVLVHCVAGISRSPTIVAAYMHRVGLLNFDNAIDHLQKLRPRVNPAPNVMLSVKKLLRVWPYDGSYEKIQ